MKKVSILSIFILYLAFNIPQIVSATGSQQNIFKQGVYTLADLNRAPDNLYEVENVSQKESAYIAIFDEENITLQTIRLSPNSKSYNLVPIKADYKIVILNKGEVYIKPLTSK